MKLFQSIRREPVVPVEKKQIFPGRVPDSIIPHTGGGTASRQVDDPEPDIPADRPERRFSRPVRRCLNSDNRLEIRQGLPPDRCDALFNIRLHIAGDDNDAEFSIPTHLTPFHRGAAPADNRHNGKNRSGQTSFPATAPATAMEEPDASSAGHGARSGNRNGTVFADRYSRETPSASAPDHFLQPLPDKRKM